MKRKREWFDDDAFWREMYPYMFSEQRIEEAENVVKSVLRLAKPKGKAVMDLCCGPARYATVLAKKGYSVTGVDKTQFLLNKARAHAAKAKVKIELVRADMRDFVRPGAFNLILSVFTSFGYFEDKNEDVVVLKNIFASLQPGGQVFIDTLGKERLAKVFVSSSCESLPDGSMLVQRREVVDDWTRLNNEWIVLRKGRSKSYKFRLTVYSGQELRDRLEQAGFVEIRLFGSFEGDPYDSKAQRLIVVARKPGLRR